jgi:hypothetical protein
MSESYDLRREVEVADMRTLVDVSRIRGNNANETFIDEDNESSTFLSSNPNRIKAIIINEGNRDLFLRYVDPAIAGAGITLGPGDIYEEEEFTGNIYGIWTFNPNGSFSTIQVYITREAKLDLNILYPTLQAATVTDVTFPPFTNGTTIFAGVYKTAGAVTPAGTITISGNATDIFVFIITGALTIGANTTFVLSGGVTTNNIFFVVDGAVILGADSINFGTFVGLVAMTVGVDATLDGRVLSLGGAIVNGGDVSVPTLVSPYELGYLVNFALFTSVGALSGAGEVLLGDIGSDLGAITILPADVEGEIYDHDSLVTITIPGGVRITEITWA